MPATYTASLRLTKPANGDTNWGGTVNTGVTDLVDSSVAGTASITMTAADYTLSNSNGVADEARAMFLVLGGTPGASYNVICPAVSKLYFVTNNTGYAQTIKTSAGTGISVPNGARMTVRCDGTNVVVAQNYFGSLTLGAALPIASGGTGSTSTTYCSLTTNVTGTLPVANGGTGATTLTGILKGSGTSAFTAATAGTDYAAPGSTTTYTVVQNFAASGITLKGSSTGTTTFASANASATNYTITFPAVTSTLLTNNAYSSGLSTLVANTANTPVVVTAAAGQAIRVNAGGTAWEAYTPGTGSGSVTSVAQSFTGGLISVSGSPITTSGTLALTVAGTSGGIPYFSGASTWASSAALAANALMVGGGAGAAPSTVTTGTGVVTALGVNTGSAGAFVVNGGALGTPSSGTVTNLTGTASININGTVGATTANTGAFTSVTSTSAAGILTRAAATQDGVELIGRAGGTLSYKVTFTPTTLTASRTLTLPDNTGTLLTTGATVTVAQGGTGATTLTGLVKGNGTSAFTAATAGTDYVAPSGALGTPSSGTLTNCTADGTNAVGFREIPQNSQSAAYTLVLADSGKQIFHPSADVTARTFTIPANSSVAFPIGTAVTFINQNGAGTITIAINTDTMRLAGAGTTGSRTLAANGVATAIKVASTEWIISGTNLT